MKTNSVDSLLETLYELSGIHFSVDNETDFDESNTQRIDELVVRLRSKLSPVQLMERYINGLITYDEIITGAHDIHFEIPALLDLMIISFKESITPESVSVINSLYDPSNGFMFKKDNHTCVLIHSASDITSVDDYIKSCSSIRDMLNMEAMVNACIAFDRTCTLAELPVVYQHTETALRIGYIFDPDKTIYNYHDLGLGKLLFNLPTDVCANFLKDSLPDVDFSTIDNETLNIITTFLDNGLNLAETARILYMHRNTLVYRLEKFKNQTNLDLKQFDDAVLFRIGTMIYKYLKAKEKSS